MKNGAKPSDTVRSILVKTGVMKQFQDKMELYRACGGVHASAFSDGAKLLVVAEDIGIAMS
jgi:formate dehydrogenase assembly factor FdhD